MFEFDSISWVTPSSYASEPKTIFHPNQQTSQDVATFSKLSTTLHRVRRPRHRLLHRPRRPRHLMLHRPRCPNGRWWPKCASWLCASSSCSSSWSPTAFTDHPAAILATRLSMVALNWKRNHECHKTVQSYLHCRSTFLCFIGFQRFTIIESKINQNKKLQKSINKNKQKNAAYKNTIQDCGPVTWSKNKTENGRAPITHRQQPHEQAGQAADQSTPHPPLSRQIMLLYVHV